MDTIDALDTCELNIGKDLYSTRENPAVPPTQYWPLRHLEISKAMKLYLCGTIIEPVDSFRMIRNFREVQKVRLHPLHSPRQVFNASVWCWLKEIINYTSSWKFCFYAKFFILNTKLFSKSLHLKNTLKYTPLFDQFDEITYCVCLRSATDHRTGQSFHYNNALVDWIIAEEWYCPVQLFT